MSLCCIWIVDYLACEKICIPFQVNVALDLSSGPAAPTPFSGLIAKYAARVPGPAAPGGLAIDYAGVAGQGADRALRIVALSATPFTAPELFVEGPETLYFAPPEVELGAAAKQAVFRLAVPEGRDGAPLEGVPVTFTLVDGERAVERTLVTGAAAPEAPRLGALAVTLVLAFIGGLILNLMPCVLPVLPIKLMGR